MAARQGRLGEKHFSLLCEKFGAVSNPATDDQNGWDVIVEFPPSSLGSKPLDLVIPIYSALVQVKTTSGDKVLTSHKLSNALKFTYSDLPCFLFMLHYPDGLENDPIIYAKHFWDAMVLDTLRSARKVDLQGTRKSHQVKISVGFDIIDKIDGDFVDWMRKTIEVHGSEYSLRKSNFRENCGYGEFRSVGHFSFGQGVKHQDIVDMELGLVESLPISELTVFDNRFGLKSKAPIFTGNKGSVAITRETIEPLQLTITGPEGKRCKVQTKAFASTFFGQEDTPTNLRISVGYLDMLFSFSDKSSSCTSKTDPQKGLSIDEFWAFFNTVLWSCNSSVQFQLGGHGKPKLSGSLRLNYPTLVEPANRILPFIKLLRDILGPERSKTFIISWVRLNEMYESSWPLSTLITPGSIKLNTILNGGFPSVELLTGYLLIEHLEYIIFAIYDFKVLAEEQIGNDHTWYLQSSGIATSSFFQIDSDKAKVACKSEFNDHVNAIGSKCMYIDTGDLPLAIGRMIAGQTVHFVTGDEANDITV